MGSLVPVSDGTNDERTSDEPASEPEPTTESEEMFLITVARAIEDGHSGPVPVPRVAEELSISRVSANEMAKKLVSRGFVSYEPYRGVTLTDEGSTVANTVLRRRRLWSLFLADHLGLAPSVADAIACEFEHITPGEVAARLSGFLGDPTTDPAGKPIPAALGGASGSPAELTLADAEMGGAYEVLRIAGDGAIRSFLAEEGLSEGAELSISATAADGARLISAPGGRIHLSPDISAAVIVRAAPD